MPCVIYGEALGAGHAGDTVRVTVADRDGGAGSTDIGIAVTYNVCLPYDPATAHKSGSTVPIKLQLCDAAGCNLSSAGIVVAAQSIVRASDSGPGALEDSGSANPDDNFRFDPTLGCTGGYIFNLSTKGLATGTYTLTFIAMGDPVPHTVQFQVR